MDLFQELKNLIANLRESKVDYALCGGFALLDVLHVTPGLEEFWRSRVEVVTDFGRIVVVSRQGLIGLKQLRASPLDLLDIASLGGSP